MCTSASFKDFCAILNPRYQPPSYPTVRNLLSEAHHYCKNVLLPRFLSQVAHIAVTTDIWTSRDHRQFISVTLHWINQSDFANRDLELISLFPYPHKATDVAAKLESIVNDEYGFGEKVVAAVSDNGANMVAALRQFKDVLRLPCVVHTLNLVVKSAMDVNGMNELEARLRKLIGFVRDSDKRRQLLRECQTGVQNTKDLIGDCPTRFNSFIIMVKRLLDLKVALAIMEVRLQSMKNASKDEEASALFTCADARETLIEFRSCLLSENEWLRCQQLYCVMSPFVPLGAILGATQYPTLSLVLPTLEELKRKIAHVHVTDPLVESVRDVILDVIEERWFTRVPGAAAKTAFFDPRFKKLTFLTNNDLRNLVLDELQSEYNVVKAQNPQPDAAMEDVTPPEGPGPIGSFFGHVTAGARLLIGDRSNMGEWEWYQRLNEIHGDADVFKWWQARKHYFPNLFILAMRYLCIPASSIPSERLFSSAGNLVSEKRTRLQGDTIEQILFLKSCIKYQEFNCILDFESESDAD